MQTLNVVLSYLGIAIWIFGLYLAFFSHLRGMLGQAVIVAWQKKYIWLLAFFAGLSAYGGEINVLFQRVNTTTSLKVFLDGVRKALELGQVDQFFRAYKVLWVNSAGQMAGYLAITLILIAVIGWLIIVSQAAIVRIIGRHKMGKPAGLVDGLAIGTEKFWMLVQLNLIGLLVGWGLWVILTAVPAAVFLISNNAAWSITAYIGSILSVICSIVTIFLIQFATADMVLRDAKLMPAIIDAWRLFTGNIVSSLEMATAIFTVNVTLLILVFGQLFFFISPFTLGGLLTIYAVVLILYTLLSAFSFSGWTIYYLKLVEGKAPSKLGQWTNRLATFAGQKRAIE